jgi:hypothetical protein
MRVRRAALAAVSSVLAIGSVLVSVTPAADADPPQDISLPAGPDGLKVYSVSLGDGVVYATWGSQGFGRSSVYVAPDDGSGSWQQLHVPSSGDPINQVRAADDGVFVQYDATDACTRVVTATSDWLVPGCGSAVDVGHGGDLVAVQRYDAVVDHYWYDIYDSDAGPAGGVLDTTSVPPALAGTWVWTASAGRLSGVDTVTDEHRSITLGDSCLRATVLEVVDDESTLSCVDNGTTRIVLVDLVEASRPVDVSGILRMLGNGFLYAGTSGVLHVTDLSASLAASDVGAYFPRGSGWYPGPGWVGTGPADYSGSTTGSPRIAYLADAQTVHVASLSGLGAPPTTATDTTPPVITATGGSPGAVRRPADGETPISFTWSGEDDEAAAPTYDVQVKDSVHTEDTPGWQALSGAQGTFATTTVYDDPNQSRVCLRVRATDRVGNHSPWSTARCTRVDAYPPMMGDGIDDTTSVIHVLHSVGRARVTGRFHGLDDSVISSYDVERKIAPPNRRFGSWVAPQRWHAVVGHHVTASIKPGTEICFRARARDAVGRLSAWGDRRCATEPYDDATLAHRHSSVHRVAGALGKTATRLTRGASSLTSAELSGRALWVRARGAGCPHVWWGGKLVMSLGCTDAGDVHGFSWYVVNLRHRRSGPIRIAIGNYWGWTDVDAVAVGR